MLVIRRATAKDKTWLEEFLNENWGADFIVSRGKCHYPAKHQALIAEDDGRRVGLLTFREENQETEILSLDAVLPQRGVGTCLLEELRKIAEASGACRIWLITTNDNLDAMRFYQRRGFDLSAVHRGAVEQARKIKPSIPETGAFGIPVRHEIEFELLLG